jgi:NAD(P)-dependent dehydrogenase (short-subunit alcohol dehydrogenase family)
MHEAKIVLVTGASSGVGQATARLLAQEGCQVFGTSRDPARAQSLPGVDLVPLDVRDDASVASCIEAVARRSGRLDVLVNNAGYELAGALEEVSLAEAKAQFETNFFGVLRMVKAVLPMMRRQGAGQIVNVSSLAGLAPIPFMGIYAASKFAVEGYTEALRHELRPFNIRVSQVEPGFLKTAMAEHRQSAAERLDAYAPWRERAMEAIRGHERNGPGAELVARAIGDIVASRNPRLRYRVGREARLVSGLRRFLPEAAFEKGARKNFRLA